MENPVSYTRHHKYIMSALAIAVVLTTAIGVRLVNRKEQSTNTTYETKVSVIAAKDFVKNRGAISANGLVESEEQAEIRSQAAGPVNKVYVQIGQKIGAGQVIASLKNNDLAAGLAQAQAFLKSQQARLEEMKKGMRTEQLKLLETKVSATKQALEDTKSAQEVLVKAAHTAFLNTGLAIMPKDQNVSGAKLSLTGSYTLNKEGTYILNFPAGGQKPPVSLSGLETGFSYAIRGTPLPIASGGLYLNISLEGDIFPGESWIITIPNPQAAGYAQAKNAYEAALNGRNAAVNAATNAVAAAQQEYELALAGASNEQIKAQEAAVEQAVANVAMASAQLEKTIIRSPINGVIASIQVKYGELVNPGSMVASVVNKTGLQIKAFFSESDLPFVKEGAEAVINEKVKGKIIHLSPSIDPVSKNVEVRTSIENPETSGLVVGQNVSLKIVSKQENDGTVYLLPIQSIKVSNSGASIFVVNENSTLAEKKVVLGEVAGEFVEVKEGIAPENIIVSAAYELKDGQKVLTE